MANLLAQPSAIIGLMGALPRRQNSLLPFFQPVDAGDEYFLNRPQGGDAPVLPEAVPVAAPQRERVSFWRGLDRVLGGETITGALDSERARLQAIADQPQIRADQERIRRIVAGLPEIEQLAYATNPQELGKALASNSEGYSLSAGGLRGGRGGVVASAPTYTTVNDTIFSNDRGVSTPVATAPPGYNDITLRNKAESEARLAALGIGIQQQNADTAAANSGFTLAPGQSRFTPGGASVASVAPTADPKAAENAAKNADAARSAQITLGNTRAAIQRARDQAGIFSTGQIAGAIPFNQSRRDLEATIDTIKANLAFNELAKMRANSPTGGALGSITERELASLGSTVASLDPSQSTEQLLQSLNTIDTLLKGQQTAAPTAQAQGPARPRSEAEYRALPSGTEYIDPNNVRRRKP